MKSKVRQAFSAQRRQYLTALSASMLLPVGLQSPAAMAQSVYPNRPIKLVIGYTTGGAGDALARMMAQKYSEVFSQSVLVENKPGASATIAAAYVAKSPADGYTLLINTAPDAVIAPLTMSANIQYDAQRDFAPVGLVVTVPSVLVVPSGSPYKTVEDIIKAAKSRPGKLNYGSGGNGTAANMAAELFKNLANLDILHIAFKGSSPAMVELLAGRLDFMFDTFASAWPQIQSGKLRPLGVTTASRVPLAPNIPTMEEQGFKGCIWQSFIGVTAPAATPPAILKKLYDDTAKIVAMSDVQKRIIDMGMIPGKAIGPEYAAFIQAETKQTRDLIRQSNIRFN
ncbi:Bordetella uptake gene [Burkholderiaceae bacterium]